MTPALDSALAACDEIGVTLSLNGDKVAFVTSAAGLPDELRSQLTAVRAELVAYLAEHHRPAPEPVQFVATNLDVWAVWSGLARGVSVIYSGDRPFYLLTPAVWWYLASAVDVVAARDPAKLVECRDAAAVLARLGRWVDRHYRPDQIRRACFTKPSLPRVRKPDPPEPRHAHGSEVVPPAKAFIRVTSRI